MTELFTGDKAIDDPWFARELDEYFELYAEIPLGLVRDFDAVYGPGNGKAVATKKVIVHELVMQELGDRND